MSLSSRAYLHRRAVLYDIKRQYAGTIERWIKLMGKGGKVAGAQKPIGSQNSMSSNEYSEPAPGHVVEDETDARMIMAPRWTREGFVRADAEDGARALEVSTSAYRLVLSSEAGDGRDATCAALRERQTGSRVPIVMLTVLNDNRIDQSRIRRGATDVITKPMPARARPPSALHVDGGRRVRAWRAAQRILPEGGRPDLPKLRRRA